MTPDVLVGVAWGIGYGALVGAAFFAVLWVSVRRTVASGGQSRPLLIGALFRILVILAAGLGLILLGADLALLAGTAIGFTAVRVVAVKRVKATMR